MSGFDSPNRRSQPYFERIAAAQHFPLTPQMAAAPGMPSLTAPVLEQADRRFDQMTGRVAEMERRLNILDQGVMAIKTQADQKVNEITKKVSNMEGVLSKEGSEMKEEVKHMKNI